MKGWLALDVDGTLTHEKYSIPDPVIFFLRDLHFDGWKLVVLTGRSYPFAEPSIQKIDFPFILSTQNGSSAWFMPQKEIIFQKFLEKSSIKVMEECAKNLDLVFIVYSADRKSYGKENGSYEEYVKKSMQLSLQEHIQLDDFEKIDMDLFPLAKFVGKSYDLLKLRDKLNKYDMFEMSMIKDPFCEDFYLLLITKKNVSKGSSILNIMEGQKGKIIAAGNDENDITMLQKADVAIAMEDAPQHVLKYAHIIARSAKENGIIEGLKKAINLLNL